MLMQSTTFVCWRTSTDLYRVSKQRVWFEKNYIWINSLALKFESIKFNLLFFPLYDHRIRRITQVCSMNNPSARTTLYRYRCITKAKNSNEEIHYIFAPLRLLLQHFSTVSNVSWMQRQSNKMIVFFTSKSCLLEVLHIRQISTMNIFNNTLLFPSYIIQTKFIHTHFLYYFNTYSGILFYRIPFTCYNGIY